MVAFNRAMLPVELFCFWWFLASDVKLPMGPDPTFELATFLVGSLAAGWSVYNGIKWHFIQKDGEGLAWACIGCLVFLGLTARVLVAVAGSQ